MDSAPKIISCMQLAAKKSQLPIPSAHDVAQIIGISLRPAIAKLFNITERRANEVAEHYSAIFIGEDQTPCPLFEGAKPTLAKLKQRHILGVATGKARRGLERAWENTQSAHFFDASRCADDAESKPSPDMLEQLLEYWQVEPQQVLMVGDTVFDMQMAEAIGMPRLGVSYGVHSAEALEQHRPIAIIDSFADILEHV